LSIKFSQLEEKVLSALCEANMRKKKKNNQKQNRIFNHPEHNGC